MKRGLLLINLGTPDTANLPAVRHYLREFLIDHRVIDLPWPIRYLLVYGLIIPFRARKSTEAYKAIWLKQGSPLLYHSQQLVEQLQHDLGSKCTVALGMSYGNPSIASGLEKLNDCNQLTIVPLYPQYSSAATGSAIEQTLKIIAKQEIIPSIKIISNFYQHPAYIQTQVELIKMHLNPKHHLLFSYHGIPERQILKGGCSALCIEDCSLKKNPNCYKAQCYRTSQLIAQGLNLSSQQYSTSFQSRLGKTPWIKPYTDELLVSLVAQGIKNLAITCPSFVTDCLETLEEIGIRAQKQWSQLGGEQFVLIPSMNSNPLWINALKNIAQQ